MRHGGQARVDALKRGFAHIIRLRERGKAELHARFYLVYIALGNLHFIEHGAQIGHLHNSGRGLIGVYRLPLFHRNRHHRAIHRRGDAGVAQIGFGGVDGNLGLADRRLQLGHRSFGRGKRILRIFQRFARSGVFFPQSLLALIFFIGAAQSNLGGNQLRLISVELGFIGV